MSQTKPSASIYEREISGLVKGAVNAMSRRQWRYTARTFKDGGRKRHVSILVMRTRFVMVAISTSHPTRLSITNGKLGGKARMLSTS